MKRAIFIAESGMWVSVRCAISANDRLRTPHKTVMRNPECKEEDRSVRKYVRTDDAASGKIYRNSRAELWRFQYKRDHS